MNSGGSISEKKSSLPIPEVRFCRKDMSKGENDQEENYRRSVIDFNKITAYSTSTTKLSLKLFV